MRLSGQKYCATHAALRTEDRALREASSDERTTGAALERRGECDESGEELRRAGRAVSDGRMRDDTNEESPERVHSRGVLPDDTVSPTQHRGLPRPRLPVRCRVWLPHSARESG